MKKLAIAAFIGVLSITTPVLADTDLSSMSVEELAALKNDIEAELASRDSTGAFILPSGTYEIGVDLKSGKFLTYPVDREISNFVLGDTRDSVDIYESDDYLDFYPLEDDPQLVTLEDGKWYCSEDRILFVNAETTLMPWMPGYGDSDESPEE